jgi:hypothetical protein
MLRLRLVRVSTPHQRRRQDSQETSVAITIQIDGKTYQLSDETADTLIDIARRNGVSPEVALKQAILNEKFIEQQTASGAKLLIEKNGSLRELVFNKAPAPSA